MRTTENQFLCIKDLVADDGVHFKKFNCYTGSTKVFDESLTSQGELPVKVSFYGGNGYLERLTYKGAIKADSNGVLPEVRAKYILLSMQDNIYSYLGVVWEIDGNEVTKLERKIDIVGEYNLEIRNTDTNQTISDKKLEKSIKDRIKNRMDKKIAKEKVQENSEE